MLNIGKVSTMHAPKFTDRRTVSSSDPLRKNENTFLLNTLNNTAHRPKKRNPTKTKHIYTNGVKWKRTNEEVKQLYGELDIVIEIKKVRLRCVRHVERMSEERVVNRLYQNTPEGSRNVERPRLRWMDDVREDLRRMGVTNWRIRAHSRDDCKKVVKEAKVLQGL
jgi:hypothetical protein